MLLSIAILVLAATTAAPGVRAEEREKRISGGKKVARGELPWIASLQRDEKPGDNKHCCGGTLVARQWVLSSQSCFDHRTKAGYEKLEEWKVVLGEIKPKKKERGEQTFKIIDAVRYTPYDGFLAQLPDAFNDVILLKLDRPAKMTRSVKTVALDADGTCGVPGKACVAHGWGQEDEPTEEKKDKIKDVQQKISLAVVTQAACAKAQAGTEYEGINILPTKDIICASKPGQGLCNGDQGAPLVCKCDGVYKLVGSTAGTQDCKNDKYHIFFSRISFFAKWIKDNTQ